MYNDEQEPKVTLPEKLEFIDTNTNNVFEVDSNDFGVDSTDSSSVTYRGDVSGYGDVTFTVSPEDGYPINPPADAYVTSIESGSSLKLQQSTISEISITMPEDLEDLEEDEY